MRGGEEATRCVTSTFCLLASHVYLPLPIADCLLSLRQLLLRRGCPLAAAIGLNHRLE